METDIATINTLGQSVPLLQIASIIQFPGDNTLLPSVRF